MPEYTEQQIINGCLKNDPACEERLYKTYYSTFLTLCARYAPDMPDAKMLLNDGFYKIFTRIDTYKNQGSFEGWMKKVMVNTCLDYLKSSYLKNFVSVDFSESEIEKNTNRNEGYENLGFNELIALIQGLPPVTRTVFNLYVFENYTHKQVGALLHISEGTSAWHLHHARGLLQKLIIINNKAV